MKIRTLAMEAVAVISIVGCDQRTTDGVPDYGKNPTKWSEYYAGRMTAAQAKLEAENVRLAAADENRILADQAVIAASNAVVAEQIRKGPGSKDYKQAIADLNSAAYAASLRLGLESGQAHDLADFFEFKYVYDSTSSTVDGATHKVAGGQKANETKDLNTQPRQSGWQISRSDSAMDGKIIKAQKDFEYPEKATRIFVALECKQQAKDLTVSLESYTLANGSQPVGSAFVVAPRGRGQHLAPVGRIKFAAADPISLGTTFVPGQYANVITWYVRGSALTDAMIPAITLMYGANAVAEKQGQEPPPFDPKTLPKTISLFGAAQVNKVGVGNYLKARLPVVIEAGNQVGTAEISIPENDGGLNELIDSCSVPGTGTTVLSLAESDTPEGIAAAKLYGGAGHALGIAMAAAERGDAQAMTTLADHPGASDGQSTRGAATPGVATTTGADVASGASPSFDCTKASNTVETLICRSPELSQLDVRLGNLYRDRRKSGNGDTVKRAQVAWLKARADCVDERCLIESYQKRIRELQ